MVDVALVGAGHIHTPGFVKKMNERADVNVKYVWDHDVALAAQNARTAFQRSRPPQGAGR